MQWTRDLPRVFIAMNAPRYRFRTLGWNTMRTDVATALVFAAIVDATWSVAFWPHQPERVFQNKRDSRFIYYGGPLVSSNIGSQNHTQ